MIKKNGKRWGGNRLLLGITLIGLLPLIAIFILTLFNPQNPVLNTIYIKIQNIPAITSAFNPVMTRVMDLYCKITPFIAVIIFIFASKDTRLIREEDRAMMIVSGVFTPLVYCLYIYLFLLNDIELTMAGRPVNLLSENNMALLIFYSCLYYSGLFMTFGVCHVPMLFGRLLNKR